MNPLLQTLLPDAAIDAAWVNADFGNPNPNKREFIHKQLWKVALDYANGQTASAILCQLGLIERWAFFAAYEVPNPFKFTDAGRNYFLAMVRADGDKNATV